MGMGIARRFPLGLELPIVVLAADLLSVAPFVVQVFEEALGSFGLDEAATVRALPIPLLREVASPVEVLPTLRGRLWMSQSPNTGVGVVCCARECVL
jgi:hypothetical protein